MEKLTEETLRDWNHLAELLSICEGSTVLGIIALLHYPLCLFY